MNGTTRHIPSQSGRRVLITGGNSGIGFYTALELARRGAEVILPTRTREKANTAIEQILAEVPSAKLTTQILDLSSVASIRSFVRFFAKSYPGQSLDLLINNAGIMNLPKREMTADGFERQFCTNYLGPFILNALLYPHLRQQVGTRIVTVSSKLARNAKLDFRNLQSEKTYTAMNGTYAQSKLANLVFMLELQRRLDTARSPVISVGAHPGLAKTNLASSMSGFARFVGNLLMPIVGQDAAHGALPLLHAATSNEVIPAGYYGPEEFFEQKGNPVLCKIPDSALEPGIAIRLWEISEMLTGVKFDLNAHMKN